VLPLRVRVFPTWVGVAVTVRERVTTGSATDPPAQPVWRRPIITKLPMRTLGLMLTLPDAPTQNRDPEER
jgi:hypothetical protein